MGKQEAVEEILAVADLFLLPSESESFGLAALEAMACEVPMVSSNAGGLPEVNVQGVTGFLREIGDTKGMADDCLTILSDEKTHKAFSKNAFKHAHNFDIAGILPKYEALYQRVLAQSLV